MKTMHKHIDVKNIVEIAVKGLRRAYVFMGLGISSAGLEELNKFDLSDRVQIQIVSSTHDAKIISHYKEEFKIWIISNGLREAIESYAIFLDSVHDALCSIDKARESKGFHECTSAQKKIEYMGIKGKLDYLDKTYSITCSFRDVFDSIQLARNCLAHRRGVVHNKDCNSGNTLEIKWRSLNLFVNTPDGRLFSLTNPLPMRGRVFKEGGEVTVVAPVERKRIIKLGKVINLLPSDLAEICWTILLATDEVEKQLNNIGINSGIPIKTE